MHADLIDRPFRRHCDRTIGFTRQPVNDRIWIQPLKKFDHQADVFIPAKKRNFTLPVELFQNRVPDNVEVVELQSVDIKPVEKVGSSQHFFAALVWKAEYEMSAYT